MATANPYQAPAAAVADAGAATQPVNIFSISGRIGRARYIAYGFGIYLLFAFGVGIVAAALGERGQFLFYIVWVALIIIGYMLTMQRAHDFNMSGWLALLMFVPLANLIFLFIPGTDGANRFGPPTPPNTVLVLIAAWLVPALMILGIIAAIAIPTFSR